MFSTEQTPNIHCSVIYYIHRHCSTGQARSTFGILHQKFVYSSFSVRIVLTVDHCTSREAGRPIFYGLESPQVQCQLFEKVRTQLSFCEQDDSLKWVNRVRKSAQILENFLPVSHTTICPKLSRLSHRSRLVSRRHAPIRISCCTGK